MRIGKTRAEIEERNELSWCRGLARDYFVEELAVSVLAGIGKGMPLGVLSCLNDLCARAGPLDQGHQADRIGRIVMIEEKEMLVVGAEVGRQRLLFLEQVAIWNGDDEVAARLQDLPPLRNCLHGVVHVLQRGGRVDEVVG